MGSSHKEFSIRGDSEHRSVSGKLLAGAFSLGLGSVLARDAVAAEMTTIKQEIAKLCIGSNGGGFISGQKLGWEGVLTDGKSTGFSTTDSQAFTDKMYNPYAPNDYLAGTHRNFAYTRWPAENDIIEGYYLYDVKDPNNVKESFVINKKNYPEYKESTKIHFVKGATPDQDQMVFLGSTIYVYKSPFDANGKVKPECKTGPVLPHFSHKIGFQAPDRRAVGNFIFVLDSGWDNKLQKLIIGQDAIIEDKTISIKGNFLSGWSAIDNGFVTIKDSNGTPTTYLVVYGDKLVLVNVNNINDYKETDANNDIAVEDPDGRYMFKSIKDASGQYTLYVTDTWAAKPVNVKVFDGDVGYPLQGLLAYAAGFKGAAWVVYGEDEKARLIELEDPVTMKLKVTGVPFATLKKNFGGGGQACVTLPNQVPVITKTGTVEPAPEPAPEAVEAAELPDAGGGEVDAGAETEVVSGDGDAIDAWLDGEIADMQDIYKEVGGDDTAPDVLTPPPDGTQDTPDQTDVSEGSGSDADAAIDAWLDGNGDMQDIFKEEVDGVVTPPDMSTNDGAVKAEVEPDTTTPKDNGVPATTDNGSGPLDAGRNPGVDGGSNDGVNKPPVAKPPVKPAGPDCKAGPNGGSNNAFPVVIIAGVAFAVARVTRRKERVNEWIRK